MMMATMYEVLNKFLQDPERKQKYLSLAQDDAYRDLYTSLSRDASNAIVEPGPSDKKRLLSSEARAAAQVAEHGAGTKTMVTQMYNKANLMAELKEKAGQKTAEAPAGPTMPAGPRRPGQ
ncbi:MAG: hypothetical protein ACHQAX_08350 [Gammaproteobacteria bacterium]